jgi:hypothetical protein
MEQWDGVKNRAMIEVEGPELVLVLRKNGRDYHEFPCPGDFEGARTYRFILGLKEFSSSKHQIVLDVHIGVSGKSSTPHRIFTTNGTKSHAHFQREEFTVDVESDPSTYSLVWGDRPGVIVQEDGSIRIAACFFGADLNNQDSIDFVIRPVKGH